MRNIGKSKTGWHHEHQKRIGKMKSKINSGLVLARQFWNSPQDLEDIWKKHWIQLSRHAFHFICTLVAYSTSQYHNLDTALQFVLDSTCYNKDRSKKGCVVEVEWLLLCLKTHHLSQIVLLMIGCWSMYVISVGGEISFPPCRIQLLRLAIGSQTPLRT